MIGLIIWVKAYDERPNQQRAEVLAYAERYFMVRFCGDGKIEAIPCNFLVGVEFDEEFSLMFNSARINKAKKEKEEDDE